MEEEYKRLLEEIRDAYFLVQDERIVFVNGWLAAHYGYGKGELIGMPFIKLIAPEAREQVLQYHRRRLAGQEIPERYETVLRAKNGGRVPAELSVWLTQYRDRPAVAGIVVDITEKAKQRAEYARAQEEERRRLARALHDDTVQELLLATHRLQDVAAGIYGRLPERAQEHLGEVRALIERTIGEVRRFTQDLRPDILDDMGLVPALRWLTDRLTNGDGIHAEVRVLGPERRLSPETELTLFRVAQEALSNVRRHSNASVAIVLMEFGEQKVTMSVSDDGKGFEPPLAINHFVRQGKQGLAGIVERARLLAGRHKIESAPGKGTIIRLEITA